MNIVIIYDSQQGNTADIARAIGGAFSDLGEVMVDRASNVKPDWLMEVGLLVVGTPGQESKPTKAIHKFLEALPSSVVQDVPVTAFETRLEGEAAHHGLTGFMKKDASAAEAVAGELVKKGGKLVVPPGTFFLTAAEGPLKAGELERAAEWARGIREKL